MKHHRSHGRRVTAQCVCYTPAGGCHAGGPAPSVPRAERDREAMVVPWHCTATAWPWAAGVGSRLPAQCARAKTVNSLPSPCPPPPRGSARAGGKARPPCGPQTPARLVCVTGPGDTGRVSPAGPSPGTSGPAHHPASHREPPACPGPDGELRGHTGGWHRVPVSWGSSLKGDVVNKSTGSRKDMPRAKTPRRKGAAGVGGQSGLVSGEPSESSEHGHGDGV